MPLKVILTRGLPGSGKSTWANEQVKKNPGVYKRINKDSLRAMLDCSHHTDYNEQFVLEMRDTMILKALDYGKNVIVDDTNFEPKHEIEIRAIVEDWNGQQKLYRKKGHAIIEVKFFDLPLEECIERDANRKDSVGKKVIMEMYNKYLKPKDVSAASFPAVIERNFNLSDAIICDLDGTLALLNGRDPYDASTCENDLVNPAVNSILHTYEWYDFFSNEGGHGKGEYVEVIFVSGREEKYRKQTQEWLAKNELFCNHSMPSTPEHLAICPNLLFMRPTGDFRKDAIIKQEIYEREIKGKYNVLFVLDDRLQTCKMWYSLGLPLLKFGDPEADF